MMSFIWYKEKDLHIQFSLKLTKVSVYYVIKWKYALNFVHHFLFVYSAWSARKVENIEKARAQPKIIDKFNSNQSANGFLLENILKSVNTKKSSNFKFEAERQYFSDNVEDHKEKNWKVKFKTPLFWRTLCVDYFGRHFVLFHVIIEAGMYNEYSLSDSI